MKHNNMGFLAGLLLGIFAPLVTAMVVGWLRKRRSRPAPEQKPTEQAKPPAPETPQAPIAKLMALTSTLDAVGEASAHPRDLIEHKTFKKAVDMMKSPDFPLTTLVDTQSAPIGCYVRP